MKAVHNFILKIEGPFKETFKTESGLELYGDKDFTYDRQSNRVGKVIAVPKKHQNDIKEGYEILIDPSMFYRQSYNSKKQGYKNIVDYEKGLYHIESDMVVCYRENEKEEWKGFLENVMVEPIYEENNIETTLLLPQNATEKKYNNTVKIKYINLELKKQGVDNDDVVFISDIGGLKFWIDGKEYWWIRNRDIHGKQIV